MKHWIFTYIDNMYFNEILKTNNINKLKVTHNNDERK